MPRNFPDMGKETLTQVEDAQRIPPRISPGCAQQYTNKSNGQKLNPKKKHQRKAMREKHHITQKGTPIRKTADFSAESLQGTREWQDIFKVMKGQNLEPRIFYPIRLSFRFNG